MPAPRLIDYFAVVGRSPTDRGTKVRYEKGHRLQLRPTLLSRYPFENHPGCPLPEALPQFCTPVGMFAEYDPGLPTFFTFSLCIEDNADKLYACCLSFHEPEDPEAQAVAKLLALERASFVTSSSSGSAVAPTASGSFNMSSTKSLVERRLSMNGGAGADGKPKEIMYWPKMLCVVSHYPFYAQLKEFLAELYRLSLSQSSIPIERVIGNFVCEVPVPPRGLSEVIYAVGDRKINFQRPRASELPMMSLGLRRLFECLDIPNVVELFAHMVLEQQVIVRSRFLSVLNEVVEGICSFLFPMYWHHACIPVLPESLVDFLQAPTPYIIGLHSSIEIDRDVLDAVTIIDLDENTVERVNQTGRTCAELLPPKKRESLETRFRRASRVFVPPSERRWQEFPEENPDLAFMNAPAPVRDSAQAELEEDLGLVDGFNESKIREAAVYFHASVLKNYKKYLTPTSKLGDPDDLTPDDLYNKEAMLYEAPDSYREFLYHLLETQAFALFVESAALHPEDNYEKRMLDDAILDKSSKRVLSLSRAESRSLDSGGDDRITRTVRAMDPDASGIDPDKIYSYATFPRLKPDHFAQPRPVPQLQEHADHRSAAAAGSSTRQSDGKLLSRVSTQIASSMSKMFSSKQKQRLGLEATMQSTKVFRNINKMPEGAVISIIDVAGRCGTPLYAGKVYQEYLQGGRNPSRRLIGSIVRAFTLNDRFSDAFRFLIEWEASGWKIRSNITQQLTTSRTLAPEDTSDAGRTSPYLGGFGGGSGGGGGGAGGAGSSLNLDSGAADGGEVFLLSNGRSVPTDHFFQQTLFECFDECARCSRRISAPEIHTGWTSNCDDYQTTCPKCSARFEASYKVLYVDPLSQTVTNSERVSVYSLHVMRKQTERVHQALGGAMMSPDTLRQEHPELYWNILWFCFETMIPLDSIMPSVEWVPLDMFDTDSVTDDTASVAFSRPSTELVSEHSSMAFSDLGLDNTMGSVKSNTMGSVKSNKSSRKTSLPFGGPRASSGPRRDAAPQ